MNRETIFTVQNRDLERLDQDTAVEFFQKLLWAEARRLGIEISKVSISRQVNTPDGGIDATVDAAQIASGHGIIKPGKTGYQIKSGTEFKPWQKSVIKNELFGTKTAELQNLGESIRAYLDADGTYVLVCTGIDPTESQRQQIYSNIEEYLKQCGYSDPKVEVFTQDQLIGFLETFPSLALWVNGRDELNFQTHQSWSQGANMQLPYIHGELQDDLIAKIQSDLRQDSDTVHVRVLGEPGIGKTRLILKATEEKDLSPLVIYCSASQFRGSDLMREILRDDNQFSAIVVIDECDPSNSSDFWDKLKHRGPRIKLITIYNEHEVRAGGIIFHDIPPLNEKHIRSIIQKYLDLSNIQADHWAKFCSGSPRVAHVIGNNLVNHPEDLLKPPGTVNIWERYVIGSDVPTSQEVKQRRRVLLHLALFKRFGFGRSVVAEAESIAKKVEAADPQITWMRFQEIIKELRDRKILQGDSTLYITPKALHIKLWTDWWEIYGNTFNLEAFTQGLKSELVEWFHEMFRYAAESELASRIVEDLLGPDGHFQDSEYLNTREGSRFFLALTEADAKSALKCLMRTIGNWEREALLQFTLGRRNVIGALEKIAMRRELFVDAARLLLALGEAENEGCSNNASGVFAGLFSPAAGRVAPTEAAPTERLPVLKEAFESQSRERRLLALKACKKGLESEHLSRTAGAEYRGLHMDIDLWHPKTYGELFEVYRQVWQLLSEQLTLLPKDEREVAVGILIERARRLARMPNLSDMVLDTLWLLSEKIYIDNRLLVKTVVEFLHYNGEDLPDDTRHRWEQFRDELIGSDFHSMLQRYVGMNLRVDAFDENKNYFEQGHPQIHALAQQVTENPSLLQAELPWLVTTEATNGYVFGYQIGKRDDGFTMIPTLLGFQRKAGEDRSVYFLGGYFRALFEGDVAKWEEQLDALVEDTTLNLLIPDLTYHSGMTDRAGLRLLELAKVGVMPINAFGSFFGNRVTDSLSEEVFTEWITFLRDCPDKLAAAIAIKLCYFYYVRGDRKLDLPRALTFRLLTYPVLFGNLDLGPLKSMIGYYWTEIAKAFLDRYPEKGLEFIERVLPHVGKKGTIFGTFNTETETFSVLTELAKQYPEQVWKHVSKRLDERDFFLETWVKEGNSGDALPTSEEEGVLTFIPHEKIWEWIDEDVENRAYYFAYRLVPKTLSAEKWQTSLVRAFLIRYGAREDVRIEVSANYSTESWSGELSLHLEKKQEKLLRIRTSENNDNVKLWLDEYIDSLEQRIENARIDEERGF